MKKCKFVIVLVVALAFACAGDDESSIRAMVKETFDSAKRGDIGFVMDRVSEENSAMKILLQLKEKSDKSFDMALADLGKKTKELLEGKELKVDEIDVVGDRAVVTYFLVSKKLEERGECLLVKKDDVWKFRTLPGLGEK